jgi:hypothetical protein
MASYSRFWVYSYQPEKTPADLLTDTYPSNLDAADALDAIHKKAGASR